MAPSSPLSTSTTFLALTINLYHFLNIISECSLDAFFRLLFCLCHLYIKVIEACRHTLILPASSDVLASSSLCLALIL